MDQGEGKSWWNSEWSRKMMENLFPLDRRREIAQHSKKKSKYRMKKFFTSARVSAEKWNETRRWTRRWWEICKQVNISSSSSTYLFVFSSMQITQHWSFRNFKSITDNSILSFKTSIVFSQKLKKLSAALLQKANAVSIHCPSVISSSRNCYSWQENFHLKRKTRVLKYIYFKPFETCIINSNTEQ